MIETTNLFEVQMGKVVDEYGNLDIAQSQYYTKAIDFQNKMNEKLATNKSEMEKYQAMYYGMLNSQLGSDNKEASYLMSESLTKAGYDIASLYNLDVDDAMNKLKSGLAGQIESLRQIGIDVSEASLAKVLDQVGIDRSVQQLSYAEKEVARYIAIVQQAGQAQGDFARTFEQPANQVRVFKNQLVELKQVAGSFFIGLFGQVMPAINGIIMAIKEVLKALGAVFGFEVNTGNSSLGAVADTMGDIDSGIGSATKKAKEFKKQLMGFDEINNITPPSENNGGSGGGSVTGIDSALLDALKEWDNKMDSISGEAQKIRDNILEWLGFTKDVNGNLEWSWKNMNGIAKVLSIVAGIVGGIYVIGKLTKLVTWLKTLFTILKTGKGATTTFGLGLQTISKAFKTLKTGISLAISQYKIFREQGKGVIESLSKTSSNMFTLKEKITGVTVGLASLVGGCTLAYNGMYEIGKGAKDASENIGKLITSAGLAIGGGALAGFMLGGPIGAGIGAIVGLLADATSMLFGFIDAEEEQKAYANLYDGQGISITNLKDMLSEATGEMSNFSDKILEYNDIQKESNTTIKDANDTIELYLEKLGSTQYKLTAEDLNILKQAFSDVENATVKSSEATANSIIITTNRLKDLGKISENTAQIVVDSAIRRQLAEGESAKALATAQSDLTQKYYNGKITYEEYLSKMAEAEQLYGNNNTAITELDSKFNKLAEDISKGINLENPTKLKELVGDLNSNYKEQKDKIDEAYISSKNLYDNLLTQQQQELDGLEEGTDAYNKKLEALKATKETLSGLEEQYNIDLSTLEGNYKGIFSAIFLQIEDSGTKLDETTKEVKKNVEETLSSIGKDIKITGVGKQVFDGIANDLTAEGAKKIHVLSTIMDKYGIDTYSGYIEGMQNSAQKDRLSKAVGFIADLVDKGIAEPLEIHSPSKLMTRYGEYTVEGLVNGINSATEKIKNAMQKIKEMIMETANQISLNFKFNDSSINSSLDNIKNSTSNKLEETKNIAYQKAINIKDNIRNGLNINYYEMYNIGNNVSQGLIDGMNNKSWSVSNTAKTIAQNIVTQFKNKLQIHSPSRIMENLSKFIPLGIAKGIDDEANTVYNSISELSEGIKINPKDFEVDTNQFVDYGAIKGEIETKNQISIDGLIAEMIKEAVIEGMRDSKIKVEVEAKADENGIFNIVQTGANEYYIHTGKNPFPA